MTTTPPPRPARTADVAHLVDLARHAVAGALRHPEALASTRAHTEETATDAR